MATHPDTLATLEQAHADFQTAHPTNAPTTQMAVAMEQYRSLSERVELARSQWTPQAATYKALLDASGGSTVSRTAATDNPVPTNPTDTRSVADLYTTLADLQTKLDRRLNGTTADADVVSTMTLWTEYDTVYAALQAECNRPMCAVATNRQ
jgi:hypothetical protein